MSKRENSPPRLLGEQLETNLEALTVFTRCGLTFLLKVSGAQA